MNQDKSRPPANTKGAAHHQPCIGNKVLFTVDKGVLFRDKTELIPSANDFNSNVHRCADGTWKLNW